MGRSLRVFLVSFLLTCFIQGVSAAEQLTLGQSIDIALKNNPQVLVAGQNLVAAEGQVGQVRATLLPNLSLEGNYTRAYQSPMTTVLTMSGTLQSISMGFDEPSDSYGYSLSLTQALYAGGKLWTALRIADDGLKLASENLRQARLEITFQTASAYYGFLRAEKMLALAKKSTEMAEAHLKQTKAMFSLGMTTRADILRAEVQIASAKHALIQAKNGLEIAKSNFNSVLGQDLDKEVVVAGEKIKVSEEKINYQELLEEAYLSRPEWIKLELSRKISEANVSVAYSDFWPSLSLSGSYGWQDTEYKDSAIKYGVGSWRVMAAGQWKIFSGLGRLEKIKEAGAQLKSAQANEELLRKAIALEIKQAYLELLSAREQIGNAEKGVESGRENLRLSQEKYKSGIGTNIEILNAQISAVQAELDLLGAQFDYLLSKAKINKAVGKEMFALEKDGLVFLRGVAKYVQLEGGFVGFVDRKGEKYDLMGEKAKSIDRMVGKSKEGKSLWIKGYPRKNIVTIRMWGMPFEVVEFGEEGK